MQRVIINDINYTTNSKIKSFVRFDYSSNGVCYITICSKDKAHIFGEVVKNDSCISNNIDMANKTPLTVGATLCRPSIILSDIGKIVNKEIERFSEPYQNVLVEKYVIMPNHIHMLIAIDNKCERQSVAPTVSNMVMQFNRVVSIRARKELNISESIWQKSFYDHIVRDEKDHKNIWDYIDVNLDKWLEDEYYNNM